MRYLILSVLVLGLACVAPATSYAQATKAPARLKAVQAKPATKKPLAEAAAEQPAAESTTTAAGGVKPIAVLSIAGYDEIMGDIGWVGKLSDQPDLNKSLEGLIQFFTQGQGLKGLDKARPWGAALTTDDIGGFQPLVFLPVNDLPQLLGALAILVGEPQDAGGGVYEIQAGPGGQKAFIKAQGTWAYIGQTAESLGKLPADPTKMLGGLDKKYDVAIRVYVQNIPEVFRTMAIDQLKQGVESGLDRKPDEDDASYELRKTMIENQLKSLTSAINETEQVTLGWSLDQKVKSAVLDLNVSAVAGTKMATQLAQIADGNTAFSGFVVPESAVNGNLTAKIAKEDIAQTVSTLGALRANALREIDKSGDLKDDQKETVKKIVGQLVDMFQATLESGKMDGGMALSLDPQAITLVAGAYVADSSALEKSFKELVELGKKEDPNFPPVKFDADKHAGVRFHTLSASIPKNDKAAEILDGKLDVTIGIGPKAVYVGVGTNNLAALKSAIDKSAVESSKKVAPFQITASLESILKFGTAINSDPMASMLLGELAKSPGKDHLLISVKPGADGVTYRIEAQEGLVRMFGAAVKSGGAGGVGGLR